LTYSPDPSGLKIGPYWIRPGLTRGNVAAVIFASFTSIGMTVYLSLIQPYVLTEIVQVPEARQGTITGTLIALQESIAVLLMGFVGALADRFGRPLMFATGLLMVAAGYLLYPFAASEADLYLYRLLFAAGLAFVPVMLSITVQDTPQEISRGKWIATNNICQGLGVVLLATALLGRGPAFFQSLGFNPVMAGRLSLWTAAGICLFAAMVLWRGLPKPAAATAKRVRVMPQLLAGLTSGRDNPRLAVAFAAAFVSRGDMVIVGNFLTLWITQFGVEQGLDTAAASGRAFMLFGIVQVSALTWAGVMGVLSDRMNRMTSLCVALTLATVGYSMMGQVADPLSSSAIPFAVLLGIGEISLIVAGGALLGQEAEASLRGAVIGVFNLFGALGIVVISALAGYAFDSIGRSSPFTLMGAFNGMLLVAALLVRWRAGAPTAPQTTTPELQET
jgi:MFS family permease